MALNPYIGWGLSTLAVSFLNRGDNGNDEQANSKPEELSVNETKLGTPIPAIMGRLLVKSPITIYYGDFRAEAYTETYSAHAEFSAWPLVFSLIAQVLASPVTGITQPGQAVTTNTGGGVTSGPGTNKDTLIVPLLQALFMWLLMWLINGRNLKTTIQKGFKYYLGYQQLVCWSNQGVRLRAVYLGQNKVWEGNVAREDVLPGPLIININDENLFGGVDEGGGFIGELHIYLGGENQMPDSWMQQQMQADSIQEELRGLTPAYREFVSIVVPTAYIGKNATIPETWLELEYIPNRLELGAIGNDANPAEALYEIHVNDDWGVGEPPNSIDIDGLKRIGDTLKNEGLGVTLSIANKAPAKQTIDAICEHVNAVRYQDPKTGKLNYKLIRDDYDPAEVFLLNEKNCSHVTFNRLDWQETIGEISVTYTDRQAQYEQSSITENDPTVIEISEGNKAAKSYDYPYFTTAVNALWAAKRELAQHGYPLATCTIEGNRTLHAIRTGSVIRLDWPPYGIKDLILRIIDVDLGDFNEGIIRLETIEDVFGLGKTDFGFSGSTNWQEEKKFPTGVQNYGFFELPYELMPDKDSYVYAVAAKPDADTQKWTLWRQTAAMPMNSTNSTTQWTPAGKLIYAYPEFGDFIDLNGIELIELHGLDKLDSATLSNGTPDIEAARRGGKLLIMGSEFMAWSKIEKLPSGNWRVSGIIRGIFDTVPVSHAEGEVVYFLDTGCYANVTTGGAVCLAGNTVSEVYNITTATTYSSEELNPQKAQRITTVRRSERPSPPGRIRMTSFKVSEAVKNDSPVGDIIFSWVHRNKYMQSLGIISQEDIKQYFTGQDFSLPDGVTYRIQIFVGGIFVAQYETTNAAWSYTWAQRCKDSNNFDGETRIEISAVRNNLSSYQVQKRTFQWKMPILLDACLNEAEITEKLAQWCKSDKVVVPSSSYSDEFQVEYSDMGIFILGVESSDIFNGLLSSEGHCIIPDGRIAVVTGRNTYEIRTMEDYFTFRSYFVPQLSGGDVTYTYRVGG